MSLESLEKNSGLPGAMYRDEINDLRIEKLGQRVTLISILLPCLIGAILFYAYVDIKKRIGDANNTGQVEVQSITEDFQLKVNAMNVELAKLRHSMEKKLPELTSSMEKFKADLKKTVSASAEKKKTEKELERIKKTIAKNTNQGKETIHIIDRTNKQTLSIISETENRLKQAMAGISTTEDQLKKDMADLVKETVMTIKEIDKSFKKIKDLDYSFNKLEASLKMVNNKIDALDKTLSDYENDIATNRKDISLNQIRTNDLIASATDAYEKKLTLLKKEIDKNIEALSRQLSGKKETPVKNPSTGLKQKPASESQTPGPPPITEETAPESISEKDLIQ